MQQQRVKHTRRTVLVIACAVAAATIALTIWLAVKHDRSATARSISEVRAGVLYRSGQPEGAALTALRDTYHVRTVINLEGPNSAAATRDEQAFCKANGIQFISMPLEKAGFTETQAAKFLALVGDPACRPILVHCEYGRNRTGYVVAYYRIAIDHWTYEAAMDEARRFGFPDSSVESANSLRALAGGGPAGSTPQAPAKSDR